MKTVTWIALALAVFVVAGAYFVSANFSAEEVEEVEEPTVVKQNTGSACQGAATGSCDSGNCQANCGGNCGVPKCGCGR
jgi:hypothetical protein